MMGPETQRLWLEYLDSEKSLVRAKMIPALERFIASLLARPREIWVAWAKGLAAEIADNQAEIPVRFPLFHRVLLPALMEGVLAREPGCARWLAAFEQHLLKSRDPGLPAHLQTAWGLLDEATKLDPHDQLARRSLIAHQARYLQYTLHELPSGVLYGANGATLEECGELQNVLAEFQEHVRLTGQQAHFATLIEACRFHYQAYARYLREPRPRASYATFSDGLRRNGSDPNIP